MSSRLWSSADINAAVERVAPDVLALLGDGVPRTEAAIVRALAGRHAKGEVRITLIRLAVLEQLEEQGGRHTVAPASGTGSG
jgi:hypothetical protein